MIFYVCWNHLSSCCLNWTDYRNFDLEHFYCWWLLICGRPLEFSFEWNVRFLNSYEHSNWKYLRQWFHFFSSFWMRWSVRLFLELITVLANLLKEDLFFIFHPLYHWYLTFATVKIYLNCLYLFINFHLRMSPLSMIHFTSLYLNHFFSIFFLFLFVFDYYLQFAWNESEHA
jgi:hypothetical protein